MCAPWKTMCSNVCGEIWHWPDQLAFSASRNKRSTFPQKFGYKVPVCSCHTIEQPLGGAASSVIYLGGVFYPIVFQLPCCVRFSKICPRLCRTDFAGSCPLSVNAPQVVTRANQIPRLMRPAATLENLGDWTQPGDPVASVTEYNLNEPETMFLLNSQKAWWPLHVLIIDR